MDCLFISGGCNAVYNGFDLCQYAPNTNLIVYPCANQFMVYDITNVKVLYSYSHFNKRVNCVRFLNADTIVAADGEGQLAIVCKGQLLYNCKVPDSIQTFKCIDKYIVSLCINGTVYVHDINLNPITSVPFGNNIMETIDGVQLNGSTLLALSGVDNMIHLYELFNGQLHFRTSLKGHLRSVNALQFYLDKDVFQLASGGKDGYIRIWKIHEADIQEPKVKRFDVQGTTYSVRLDSILQGHNEEVSSLTWSNRNTLASGSFDYNVLIWEVEQDIWVNSGRLGQTHGNTNQFFGVQYSLDRQIIVGYTLTGAFYVWRYNQGNWDEVPTVSGHYAEVTDLDFNEYVVSCSMDQTCRLFSQWNVNHTYHEVARPQVHGYDLHAVKQLGQCIVSGGDEKILRIFQPSAFTVNQLNYLSEFNHTLIGAVGQEVNINNRVFMEYKVSNEGVQQALGLMNIQQQYNDEDDGFFNKNEVAYNPSNINYNIPPSDALLVARSLWPEVNKLYGHGYGIQAISVHGNIIASSCTAITDKAAEILIWDSQTYKILQQLQCHKYTVVQLQFSNDGQYLASVSKDRCLAIFTRVDNQYQLLTKSQPSQRIVYCCAFSDDSKYIYTGSRDKKLRIYETIQADKPINEIELSDSITAIDTTDRNGQRLIVIGLSNGDISLYSIKADLTIQLMHQVSPLYRHAKQVNRLKFNKDKVASCSDDHTVRIYQITL